MSNLTLSLDDDLLRKTRLYAVAHDTSVNAMVREDLKGIAQRTTEDPDVIESTATPEERRQAAMGIRQVIDGIHRERRTDWQWNRDDIYEERFARWAER